MRFIFLCIQGALICAALIEPHRNSLTFTLDNHGSLVSLLSTKTDPGRLLAYHIKSTEPSTLNLAFSEDGCTWQEGATDLLPGVAEIDLLYSQWFLGFTHLVAVTKTNARDTVYVGVAVGQELSHFKVLIILKGRSPFLFAKGNVVYLGLINKADSVVFYKLDPIRDSVKASPVKIKVNLIEIDAEESNEISPAKNLINPQLFCINSEYNQCIFTYTSRHRNSLFYSYYYIGAFHFFDTHLEVQPLIKPTPFDYGMSANNFRIVDFKNQVLAVGWNGNVGTPFAPASGFTLTRVLTFTEYGINQAPFNLSPFEFKVEKFYSSDMVIPRSGFSKDLSSEKSCLLDLHFDDGRYLLDTQYFIELATADGFSGSIQLGKCADKERKFVLNLANAQDRADAYSEFHLPSQAHLTGKIKIIIDFATVTIFFEDGLRLITQSYNFNQHGRISKIKVHPQGDRQLWLKQNSSITFYSPVVDPIKRLQISGLFGEEIQDSPLTILQNEVSQLTDLPNQESQLTELPNEVTQLTSGSSTATLSCLLILFVLAQI